jgi:hypothetical protein
VAKHRADVKVTGVNYDKNKEKQESPWNATCMETVVSNHRKFQYAHNFIDGGDN